MTRRHPGRSLAQRAGFVLLASFLVLGLGSTACAESNDSASASDEAQAKSPAGASGSNSGVRRTSRTPIPDNLLESERNTIEVFRNAADAVVFVTNSALRRDRFSTNVLAVPQGTGSGFVWDDFGHVVTNYHVIQGGSAFTVTLSDGTVRDARLIGVEPRKDLAVLHFDPAETELNALPLGRSADLIVGQKVLAIGNPFGLDRTLTTGVISALGREIDAPGGFVIEDVVQSDASINPGNSGGPLIDSSGRLIGVNTAIFSPSGASAGIGFAIPADTVARIVPQLIRFGRVKRAGLGITVLPDHIMARWGIAGVGVREVQRGSEAQRAGLRSLELDRRGSVRGIDVIVAIGDEPIQGFADLANVLDPYSPGDRVTVHFERNGERQKTEVQLQELGN